VGAGAAPAGNSAAGVGDADLAGGGRWGGGSRAGPEGKARSWDGLPWGDASRSRSSGSKAGQVRPCSPPPPAFAYLSLFSFRTYDHVGGVWFLPMRIGACRCLGFAQLQSRNMDLGIILVGLGAWVAVSCSSCCSKAC
jgi:hypothetical protein